MRRGLLLYLIFGSALVAFHGYGGIRGWWRMTTHFADSGGSTGGGGHGGSGWGSGGGGFRGGK